MEASRGLRVAGFELRVDRRVPPDQVLFVDGQIVVGRITHVGREAMSGTSTTWKSLSAGYGAGLVTAGAFAVHWALGAILLIASTAYTAYTALKD